jgi:excisionase family DNA binding protein
VDGDLLLTDDELAELLGMSTRWVGDRARAGEIPHIRLGRFRRYRRADIDAWIESLATGLPKRRSRAGG